MFYDLPEVHCWWLYRQTTYSIEYKNSFSLKQGENTDNARDLWRNNIAASNKTVMNEDGGDG